MKKTIKLLISLMAFIAVLSPLNVMAEDIVSAPMDTPALTSISFKNAHIEEEFSPNAYEYSIVLENPEITPTLENYSINGDADLFVTYNTDETKHQTGIAVTLQFDNGSVIYTFNYVNASAYAVSGNNLLKSVKCNLGEVYPAINDKDTDYKLYIPSDLTEITLTAVSQEVSAICEVPGTMTLNTEQEPSLAITVTASNGDTRVYNFKVKRLKKDSDEIRAEMAKPGFKSIVDGELFYQRPVFAISIISVLGGLILLLVFIAIAKRLTVKNSDDDEVEFFISE
ncbi:MAG: hypothetical protein ACLUFN_04615 [Eubacterium sp.]